jgi:hypothetical protein
VPIGQLLTSLLEHFQREDGGTGAEVEDAHGSVIHK